MVNRHAQVEDCLHFYRHKSIANSHCREHQLALIKRLKPCSQYNADADVDTDADAGIEMNPISASASVSTSKDAACVKAVSLMLVLKFNTVNQA